LTTHARSIDTLARPISYAGATVPGNRMIWSPHRHGCCGLHRRGLFCQCTYLMRWEAPKSAPGSIRRHVFEAQKISMRPLLALTRRERDHASDVPSDVASSYFSRLLRSSYIFRGQGRSHLFFSYIMRWFLIAARSKT
jgi:hypothetical protein